MSSDLKPSEAKNDVESENINKISELTIEEANLDLKQKKKLDKLIESVLKKCGSNPVSLEDKVHLIAQALSKEQENSKKLTTSNKELEKQIQSISKQKDFAQSEYGKAIIAKDKLESLCRELQKYNKSIKEENLTRIKEEEERRKEITAKFQVSIDEINKQVMENSEKNGSLIQENANLAAKLKNLLEQYELREQHIEKVLKHKDLEIQLADAKFQQSELKFNELSERNKAEKSIFETHCNELLKKCEFHQEAEKQLRSQLSSYTEKYEEFQTTLKKSNQMFDSFKTEMDKMTKKIKKLEAETTQWKKKWESCDKSLQNVISQKNELEVESKNLKNKYDSMEKISRALQVERESFKEKIKNYESELNALKSPTNENKSEVVEVVEQVNGE
ncbi:unnamed protein product [Brachionus calyciflorus]|uniref:Uncharacterized protein n=1 Tax=Brachionus calyciflorus TaxID=104777 RepID=A0A813M414_9BILA|nr:unnamed protein product [Brachionus calyciflorus]